MPGPRPILECFMEKISPEPNSGCWLWIAGIDDCGYGKFNGRDGETLAHRFAHKYFTGPIPPGTEIDHLCNVRCCVNPAHLRAISHTENVRRSDHKTNHRNRIKTHCKWGHAFTPENVRLETYGGTTMRKCIQCCTRRQAEIRFRRKAKLMKQQYGVEVRCV